MRISKVLLPLLALNCLLATGCRPEVTIVNPDDLPPFMRVESRAFDVKAWRQSDSTLWLTYKVRAPYFPNETISSISERLRMSGFLEVPFHWSDPNIPSSRVRGWSTWNHELEGSTIGVYDWQVSWIHPNGEMVLYELQYRGGSHAETMFQPPQSDVLKVSVTHFPADVTATRSPHALEWLEDHENT